MPGARPGGWPGLRRVWPELAWAVFAVLNLAAMVAFAYWWCIPFYLIWIGFTVLYGFRVWALRPALWMLTAAIAATLSALGLDAWHGEVAVAELTEVPLMAAIFWVMFWHARRRLSSDEERRLISEENSRLLSTQRRFLQDASHQLRTPITIALGHAELLARELAGQPQASDIQVVVDELTRLGRIGERLLLIAASEDPGFLHTEPVPLDRFVLDAIRRWRPTAPRRWLLGRLDPVTVNADFERLGLAVDALVENAVRHTGERDMIQFSVVRGAAGRPARVSVTDSGRGIEAAELEHIFERFRSGEHPAGARGTGLGLALVRAVARAHGGEVRVQSTAGAGSVFELTLPGAIEGPPGAVPGQGAAAVGPRLADRGTRLADRGTGAADPGMRPADSMLVAGPQPAISVLPDSTSGGPS
jgi:signal transduction histidine kinase